MNRWMVLPVCLLALALTGCAKEETFGPPQSMVRADGLEVTLNIPQRTYYVCDSLTLTVNALNTTDEPIEIPADTAARILVKIYHYQGTGWQEVKRYPEAAAMIMSHWTIAPHAAAGPFTLTLPVEPDWPTNEILHLTAELTGRPDAAPGIAITVHKPGESAATETDTTTE